MQALVSIITINYNQAEVTCALLESLRKVSYASIEILVVDNASSENPQRIEDDYPEVKLLRSPKNLGFAGGNNLALKEARGDYLLFINNDTEVDAGFLEPLIECLQRDKSIGMVSPKIRFHHTPDTIQYAGYGAMNPYTLQQHLIGYGKKDGEEYQTSAETYSVHGAAMCFHRHVIEEVGLMADLFFLYYEEHDWALRVKKAGYKAWYVADSLVFHKESISTGKESPLKTHFIARNRILYARRNYNGIIFLLNMLFVHMISLPKNVLKYLFQGRLDLMKAYWTAFVWNWTNYKDIHKSPRL